MIRTPYRLPKKRPKVKSGIERAPKRIWLRHRRFVKSHSCMVPGCQALQVEFAHLRSAANAGTGLKPHDRYGVALCPNHHREQHQVGAGTFGDRHGIDFWQLAEDLVRRSTDMQMRLSLLLHEEAVSAKSLSPNAIHVKHIHKPPPTVDLIRGLPRYMPMLGKVG